MRYLRKNTAVIVAVGPFFDKTDGVTLETGLTITNERITLIAETDDGNAPTLVLDNVTGATSATDNDLNYITGNDAAMMQLELSAANVNRLGRMYLTITDAANHCPVFHEFTVVNTALYDAFFATSGGAIPNVAADAAGGIPISDAGGLDMDAILSRMGTPSDFGSGASVAKNLVDIEAQTDDIGIAGAGLTALGDTRIANLDATVSSRLATAGYTAPPTAAAIADAVLDETPTGHTGALKDTYDNAIQIGVAGVGLTAVLTNQITESYAANGVAPTYAQAIMAMHQLLMQFVISGTSYTVKKLDNTTTAFVGTLNDGTAPTSLVRT